MIKEHPFTAIILEILTNHFGQNANNVFELSPLLQYLNYKTRSANRGSKSRSSFANLYAIYVLIEDYLEKGFLESGVYAQYDGAEFTPLLKRMRRLPFGSKLQNHALNNRVNDEFHKFFPQEIRKPILRRVDLQRYWINESLLKLNISGSEINIAKVILEIIDQYVKTKINSFDQFIQDCERLKKLSTESESSIIQFIYELIAPERDARIFEIVSYAVLKEYYSDQIIFIGSTKDNIKEEFLKLYKTGRTNANDGGIDFVMKPLGRFFQVTETLDVKKYLLDIDKIQRYPISFVIKTLLPEEEILNRMKEGVMQQYSVQAVVDDYMAAIEEIINIPSLINKFDEIVTKGRFRQVLEEIIIWSKLEFNYVSEQDNEPGNVVDEDEDQIEED
ncbi:hypothetical protein Cri9333_2994 [Crinalium epipsammum PCC 9333]|uniref:Restriction endonuclease n=1 Tax=Crinalium epipsammum PCC 9333 TaxID=1173022 RepID=K9W0B9_9CYAN|nr:hypothetical protein [Crinalium epipsammum]AFZ13833.1 hypothetical protein Cri9333_2994 [Crinalium epipsammum PCC 9333]